VIVPGDKSIAHRWLILAATAEGESRLAGVPASLDVWSTATCLSALRPHREPLVEVEAGLPRAEVERGITLDLTVNASGFGDLRQAGAVLDCGNSATCLRLLLGVLAGRPFGATLDGDGSLRARPMERVAHPLRAMGASVETANGTPPVRMRGGRLSGIEHAPTVPSAQVKGAVLLAGMQADGTTTVRERIPTRDHTERALGALGAPVSAVDGAISLSAFAHGGFAGRVPGDVSSAAFLLAAAAVVPGSSVTIVGVGVNPSRTGFLEALARMGAAVEIETAGVEVGEPVGSVTVGGAPLRGLSMVPAETARCIDEVPVLAAVAAAAAGETRFAGVAELRVKESDRVAAIVGTIRALGGDAEAEDDDLVVGGGGLAGGAVDALGDHRIAMAFAVAGLAARAPVEIGGMEWVDVSFPGFVPALRSLGAEGGPV